MHRAHPLPRKIIPPHFPKLNGCVKRANRTAHLEGWNHYAGEVRNVSILVTIGVSEGGYQRVLGVALNAADFAVSKMAASEKYN